MATTATSTSVPPTDTPSTDPTPPTTTTEPTPSPPPAPATSAPPPTLPSTTSSSEQQPFHTSSLYVGDLAPDVNEGLLFEIFNAVGPVASIRVCRDAVTRRSLGYAYINFHQIADAERALDTMNYTMIKSKPCRIMWSQRDPSLRRSGVGNIFVKNLHESIDNKQLYDTFSLFGNILSCKVVNDRATGKSMGYGYVHYETAEAANAAIDKLDGMLIDGQEVQVGHFMRRNDRPGQADWTNCYIKNIPVEWDDAKLKEEFCKFGEVLSATISMGMPKKKNKSKQPAPVKKEENGGDEEKKKEENQEEKTVTENEDEKEEVEKKEDEDTKDKEEVKKEDEEPKKEDEEPKEEAKEEEPKIQSLGFGFVNFMEHPSAIRACEELNGKAVKTKDPDTGEEKEQELYVGRAQKKAERMRELTSKFESMKMDKIAKFQGVNLYVKNLDDAVTDDILRDEFSNMGTITSARVMRDMKDGTSRGFGFVCFSTPEESTRAVNEMNGKIICNKPIFVALAQRKEVRRAQLEATHGSRGGAGPSQGPIQGGGPQGGMMRGPMGGGPMGYPGAPMPVYMQRPGPGGNMQPVYPAMMPQMMGPGGRGPGGAQQQRGYPMMQQQRGVYPMPAYGVVPQQPGRGGGLPGQQGRGGRGRGGGQPMQGRGNVPGRGASAQQQQQQLKFNQQARNAGAPPQQQVQQQGGPPPPPNAAQPQQPPPPQQQQQQPVPPPNESLTASALASATPEMQKNMIGERLYPLIHASQPELAGKITGMLLEMDNSELLHLLESPEALGAKISEALQVLEAHNAAAAAPS